MFVCSVVDWHSKLICDPDFEVRSFYCLQIDQGRHFNFFDGDGPPAPSNDAPEIDHS